MKKLLILLNIFLSLSVFAQSNDDSQLKEKLNKQQQLSDKDLSSAYQSIVDLVDQKKTALSSKKLLELCLLYSKHDYSNAPYEIALSIKEANPKEYEKALKELSKKDAAKIKKFVEIAEDTAKNGNA